MPVHYTKGVYLCRGVNQGFGKTNTGNSQFILRFKVLAEVLGDGTVEPDNQQYERTMYQVLNANTAKFAIENIRKLGFDGDSFVLLDPDTPGFHNFAGEEFQMWCSHDFYNGKESEKWTVATGSSEFKIEKPLEKKDLRGLDNLFGKELKAAPKVARQTTAPQAVKNASSVAVAEPPDADFGGISDDDIPF